MFPMVGEGSHYNVLISIAGKLQARGHSITMLVADFFKEPLSKSKNPVEQAIHFEFFKTRTTHAEHAETYTNMTNAGLKGRFTEWLMEVSSSEFVKNLVLECHDMIGNQQLMSRLQNSNFDLSVVDNGHNCPLVQYVRKKLNIPFVALSPIGTLSSSNLLANRVPFNPSYMPEFTTGLDHVMTFSEHIIQVLGQIFSGPY